MNGKSKTPVHLSNETDRPPFERIKFKADIRAIYERTVQEATSFYCKTENEPVFGYQPESFNDKWGLFGKIIVFDEPPQVSDHVVVNFSLGSERYFTTAEFRPMSDQGVLRMFGDLFRFERRGDFRFQMENSFQNDCNLIDRNGTSIFLPAEIVNISQGGMRLRMPLGTAQSPLQAEEKLRFVLHINRRWRLEIEGIVRHTIIEDAHALSGIQFQPVTPGEVRKIMSVMMDLQRSLAKSD